MKTVHAVWEMANLGVDAWEITAEASDTLQDLAEEDERLRGLGAEYIVLRSPVGRQDLLFGLGGLRYTWVENVFHVMIRREEYHMPQNVARFDRGLSVKKAEEEQDRQRVYALVRQGIFRTDRVSIDPAFGPEAGGNRYANWLEGMIRGGGDLYEVYQKEKPIGFFVIVRKDADTVDPVLMGMYDRENDRGLGTLLHKKTLDTCFTYDCKRLTSTIVSNNPRVLRVYINAGADIPDTLYTYVKHC